MKKVGCNKFLEFGSKNKTRFNFKEKDLINKCVD